MLSWNWREIKTHLSLCLSVHQSVHLSQKTLIWTISSEILIIEYSYWAWLILVTRPYLWCHALMFTFDLHKGQICFLSGTTVLWICLFTVICCGLEICWIWNSHTWLLQILINFNQNSRWKWGNIGIALCGRANYLFVADMFITIYLYACSVIFWTNVD